MIRPTAAMRSPDDAHVGPVRAEARAVDHGAVADHEVVGHVDILASAGPVPGDSAPAVCLDWRDGLLRGDPPRASTTRSSTSTATWPSTCRRSPPTSKQEGLSLDHPALRRLVPPYGGTDAPWHDQTPEERAATRTPRGPWWSAPARQTIDLATALFPALLYERLDEIGHRLRRRLPEPRASSSCTPPTTRYRRGACRALNRCNAETFAPLADRLTPVAAIPMHTPEEAVAELEYAVDRARLQGRAVRRLRAAPVRRAGRRRPRGCPGTPSGSTSSASTRPTTTTRCGPRAQELGVSIAFHSGFIGMTPYRSPTSYVSNHLSMLAEGQQSLAKSLFLGGVTRRFPTMNFAFLEGGVAWAAALFSDIVGHWEKRNLAALRANLDPALDRPRPHRRACSARYAPDARRLPPASPGGRPSPRTCSTSGRRAASSGPRTSGPSSPTGSGSAARPTTR